MRFGVITAMPAEAKTFNSDSGYSEQNSWHFATGSAGQTNARLSAKSLLEQGCDCLISWGVAGALDPQLTVGDLIVTSAVINDRSESFKFDSDDLKSLVETFRSLDPKVGGLLYSAEKPVPLAIEKQELREKFRAESVDMESAAIAKVACDAKINFIAVRCIVDRSVYDLPVAATSSFKNNGEVNVFQLIKELTQNPLQLFSLMRLGLNYYSALRQLKKAAALLQRCL